MAGRCGRCGKAKAGQAYDVTLPGQQTRRVANEQAASKLTHGVKGAAVKPVKEGKS